MRFLFKNKFVFIILILSILAFSQMLRYGIFSMQDFHLFRLVEFDKCVKVLQIPCRWAPDSGAGYGEPIFNFYGQFPYWAGEIFHLLSFSFENSIKVLFILSFIFSAIGMYFLSRKIWKNDLSALISSIIYLYAPYRSVDVWVRGALPEAISFVFFPLIILEIERYLEKRKKIDLLLFSLLFGIMIINHNLSIILFAPFLIGWVSFRLIQLKDIKPFIYLSIAGIFAGLLSAFYLLPVVFESKYVNISATTTGVYDWRANFVTIYQLFISRFWGYGGSTWGPNDGLSLSIGQVQWIVPMVGIVILLYCYIVKKQKNIINNTNFIIFVVIGLFCLFLTHNKSTFIWNILPFMKYIQFPWRFLGTATFSLALASGIIIKQLEKFEWIIAFVIVGVTILVNFQFFKLDIWYSQGDNYFLTGAKWDEARFSSLSDYWPQFGHNYPDKISDGTYINYFPGWNKQPNKDGLIIAQGAKFSDTPIRIVGNWISLGALIIWLKFLITNI